MSPAPLDARFAHRQVPVRSAKSLAYESLIFVRGNASAIVATLLEWGLVTLIVKGHAHYLVAATIGALAGAITDFSIKRHWAFLRGAMDPVLNEGLRYVAASGFSLGLNLMASYVLVDGLHMAPIPGVIAASVIVGVAWNYPVHRWYVFPDRRPAK